MENNQNSEMDDIENKLDGLNKELEQKKQDLIKELDPSKKISEVIGDLFYNSMKSLFDTSAKLAKSLAGELLPENRDK